MQNQPNQPNGDTSTKLADKAEQAVEQVKTAAIDRVQSAREQAQSGLDQGRNQVGDRIRHVSSALRSAGDSLREEDEFIARYVTAASERIESVASYVGSADPKAVLRDAQNFARERPAWFFGGAFLLGLAAGRFLKSSAVGRDELELDDSDLEELPRRSYGSAPYRSDAYAPRARSQEPITPAATIPVTQGVASRSGVTAPYPAVRTPEKPAVPGAIGATGSPIGATSSPAGASTPSQQSPRPNGISEAGKSANPDPRRS